MLKTIIALDYESEETNPKMAVEKLLEDVRAGEELMFIVYPSDESSVEVIAATLGGVVESS